MKKENGFTLAEILITLLIIGVVAAMTLPTLISKIKDKVEENQTAVFNSKLIKGLNLTKTAGELNDTYTSTEDFLKNGLSKHLKMSKICAVSNIRECIPYDEIKYNTANSEKSIKVSDINAASKLKLNGGFKDVAAFVLGDGTPVIASYNLNCIDDPDKADTDINACFAGLYDINGSRKPNKFGSKVEKGKTVYTGDLHSFNGAKMGNCSGVIGEVCLLNSAILANNNMVSLIQAVDPSYTKPLFYITSNQDVDFQALSRDYCSKVQNGKLPDSTTLLKIAEALYYDESDKGGTIAAQGKTSGLTMKNKNLVYSTLGIKSSVSKFDLWDSKNPGTSSHAYFRTYDSNSTNWGHNQRRINTHYAVCIEN